MSVILFLSAHDEELLKDNMEFSDFLENLSLGAKLLFRAEIMN